MESSEIWVTANIKNEKLPTHEQPQVVWFSSRKQSLAFGTLTHSDMSNLVGFVCSTAAYHNFNIRSRIWNFISASTHLKENLLVPVPKIKKRVRHPNSTWPPLIENFVGKMQNWIGEGFDKIFNTTWHTVCQRLETPFKTVMSAVSCQHACSHVTRHMSHVTHRT